VLAPLRGAWESASGIRGGAGPVSATPWLPAVTPFRGVGKEEAEIRITITITITKGIGVGWVRGRGLPF
jgi:hypothetical protein